MITVPLTFSYETAKNLFELAGLEVKFCEAEIDFKNVRHKLSVWVVINPYTNKRELLETAFRRYVGTVNFEEILNGSKLTIYNSFPKQ